MTQMEVPLVRAEVTQVRSGSSLITFAHIHVPPLLPRKSQKSSIIGVNVYSLGPGRRSHIESSSWWVIEHGRRWGEMVPMREDIFMNPGVRRDELVGSSR